MKPLHPQIQGCTDGNCIWGHPGGMHTNGGCACMKIFPDSRKRIQIERNIRLLIAEVEASRIAYAQQQQEIARLYNALTDVWSIYTNKKPVSEIITRIEQALRD